jgi:RHS repeat-associated protein
VIEPPGDLPGWTLAAGVTPRLKRGFTGHEHIEGVGLIHMNGRVYDPRLGRFLSADPNVQFLDQPRGYNRYVYAQNNPLKYSDPSGYFLSVFVAWAFQAIVANYIQHQLIGAFVTGFLTGLLLSGGDVEAGLKSGVVATGFSAVGDYAALQAAEHPAVGGGDAAWASGGWKKVVAHATVGGASSEIAGGRFRDGFAGAGFTQMVAPGIGDIKGDYAAVPRTVAAAVIGGTGSALSGGNFANGAETAAFLQSTVEAAEYFQNDVGGRATLKPGENRLGQTTYRYDPSTGQQFPQDRSKNVIGHNSTTGICRQGDLCSKALNLVPGLNGGVARTHDYWLNARKVAGLNVTQLHNVGTMLPAAAVGYGAITGQVFQPLSNQQLIYLSITNSFDRHDDRRNVYGVTVIGAR